jgi:hypothetical protein
MAPPQLLQVPTTGTSTSTDAPEEWISRADAAALSGRSEDTIRRDERRHELETRLNPTGAVLLRLADLVRIGRIDRTTFTSAGGADSAEVVRARDAVVVLKVQVAEMNGKLSFADALIASLTAQLEQKDKQLASLTRAHEALVVRIGTGTGAHR